jgi:hypothetical protein
MFALTQKEHGNVKHDREQSENSNIDHLLQHPGCSPLRTYSLAPSVPFRKPLNNLILGDRESQSEVRNPEDSDLGGAGQSVYAVRRKVC